MGIKNLLALNLKQAFFSKRFLLIIIFSIILNAYHYYSSIYVNTQDEWFDKDLLTLSYRWIGFEPLGSLLFLLMPLISVIVFSDSYLLEKNSGFLNSIYTRTSKQKYMISKYISVFITGGISFILPLLVNFIIVALTLSSSPPSNRDSGLTAISMEHMFADLYFTSPIGYISLFLVVDFLFAGIFATLALAASVFIKKAFLVLLVPFLLDMIMGVTLGSIKPQIVPTYLVDPQQPILFNKPIFLLIEFLLFLSISGILYFWGSKKYE
ncbi:hypothetical protein [Bacillus wiedmannii]|uniref:hypothetical protein n=1 Tax=Bacillus wiedmannii TaxID=1890302 RepID=UPI000BEF8208|nr:hypothetical protein [Bacillus wiedmannii]PEJ98948.1 hypothetical protein CN690_19295 [Bacillus wiedmannii]PEP24158.1 hypothetical protein CN566_23940 [Bacillus wiedmannii]PFZ34036.1 hypothetical protein COL77_30410 [Bacillus wiedmannii]PGA86135.1 hypothetical protein COL94_12485 [Bacillus wiedmannii]PHF53660.1 hypothetical protein COI40_28480 [Bacillus wiedmannii]